MRTPLFAALVLAFAAPAGAASFTDLGVPGGQATGLSHNGRIVGGTFGGGGGAWRWVRERGSSTSAGLKSSNGMSAWAQPMAGSAHDDASGADVAALAYSNSDLVGGPLLLGAYPGSTAVDGFLSEAYDVSDDGIAVGLAYDESGNAIAFRWSSDAGMTKLPVNRPDNYSRANAISADGSTIIGWNDQDDGGRTGVIWQAGTPLDLLDANGNAVGEALAVNSDGSAVVGVGLNDPDSGDSDAWIWTAADGVQPIGCLAGDFGCGPAYGGAVSDDGRVVVGWNGAGFERLATIWTQGTGMQLLSDYATAHGATIPAGWTLSAATAISADGQSIAGWGLGPTGLGSWLIDLHDAAPTEAILEAHGTVNFNDLPDGPFAGVPAGTKVTMTFRLTTDGAFELEPGEDTRYPLEIDTFALNAGDAHDVLMAGSDPGVQITNDYPLSDGIHLFSTPMATSGQAVEFELFNPGGDLFDSDDLDRINRSFGPEFFEKIAWSVAEGDHGMYMDLESVSIHDVGAENDTIFANGFDGAAP